MKKKAIVAAVLAGTMVLGCSFSAFADLLPDNPAGSTACVECSDVMGENNGTLTYIGGVSIGELISQGCLDTNNGTVRINAGYIDENNGMVEENRAFQIVIGTIANNYGTVEVNDGTIFENGDWDNPGYVMVNNGTIGGTLDECDGNWGIVDTNNGLITCNAYCGEVEVNTGTVDDNYGTVDLNGLTGTVTQKDSGSAAGKINENQGIVINGKVNEDGTIGFEEGTTLYGVTYKDGETTVDNTSVKAGAKIIIEKAQTKAGYNFVKWTVTTPAGEQSYYYLGGEEIDVTNPLLLQAIYAAIAEEAEAKASFTGNVQNAVTGGRWNMGPGGTWTYRNNGIFKDTWGYITLENGRTGWFYFDKNGVMLTGWQTINGKEYYFNEAHDGTCGMMLTNTTTPDGKKVGADGARIQ